MIDDGAAIAGGGVVIVIGTLTLPIRRSVRFSSFRLKVSVEPEPGGV